MCKKITIVGDIMCEPLLLKAAKRRGDNYDFSAVFENTSNLLSESDYIIGNLETPFAGKKAKYVNELFKFNAPDDFADVIRNAGIDMVLTANNHCLDRGLAGLNRTIQVLNQNGLEHTGTFSLNEGHKEASYFVIGECKVAVINYTYGTNFAINKCGISKSEEDQINLLYSPKERILPRPTKQQKNSLKKRSNL